MTGERGPLDFPDEGAPPPRAPAGGEQAGDGRNGERARPPRALPPAPPPARPPGISRYTWFLGVVGFLFLVLVTLNTVRSNRVDSGGPGAGGRLVPFAVPLADAPARKDDDANVDARKACGVRGARILNVCEERERGPVVLALFPTDAGRCSDVLAQLERVAPRHRAVRFVAVGSRGDRDRLRGDHGRVRVGWDRDGAVASLYGLVGCPQVSFARRGGRVVTTTRKQLSDAQLEAAVRRLER